MTESEIGEIEQRLGFAVPDAYRATMLNYPFAPDSFADEFMLPNRPSEVIELNLMGVPVSLEVRRPFFVGTDGGEEWYFVEVMRSNSPVFTYELETGRHRVESPSWEAYLQHLRDLDAEPAADERAVRDRKLTKRWWEFWK